MLQCYVACTAVWQFYSIFCEICRYRYFLNQCKCCCIIRVCHYSYLYRVGSCGPECQCTSEAPEVHHWTHQCCKCCRIRLSVTSVKSVHQKHCIRLRWCSPVGHCFNFCYRIGY